MSNRDQQFRLPDGRNLGFNEIGRIGGKPLFYFHGTPSARIEFDLFGDEHLLEDLNVHLIAPDRPGCGLSDFQPDRRMMDWPADVIALADHLSLERFAVLGYSGGGPYAAVCARAIPQRLVCAGIVSGAGPFTEPHNIAGIPKTNLDYFALSHQKPWLSRLMLRMMGAMAHYIPNRMLANASAVLPAPDQIILSEPAMQRGFLAMLQESLRQGPAGAQHDTRLMVTDWDFDPREIHIPVHLWHGDADQNAPIAMGRFMAGAIPNCQASFYEGEGHLSLISKNLAEIIHTLME